MAREHHYSVRSLRRLARVDDRLVRVCVLALQLCPHDVTVIEGRRKASRQRELYEAGDSWTMDSLHLEGRAVDVAPLVGGEIPWDDWSVWVDLADAFFAAAEALGIGVEWGGNWAELDGPHFQLAGET